MTDITVLQLQIQDAKHDLPRIKEILIATDLEYYRLYEENQRRFLITRITQLAHAQLILGVFLFGLNMFFPFIERPTNFVLDIIDACDAFGWLLMSALGLYIHHLIWKRSHVTLFREINRKRESLLHKEERNIKQLSLQDPDLTFEFTSESNPSTTTSSDGEPGDNQS